MPTYGSVSLPPPVSSLPTARYSSAKTIAQASSALSFGFFLYGVLGEPTIKQVLEQQKIYAFTPQPVVITLLFVLNLGSQLLWTASISADEASVETLPHVLVYALSQVCFAAWMLTWLNAFFDLAAIAALFYALANIFALTASPSTPDAHATRAVQQLAATLGSVGFLTTLAIAMEMSVPPRAAKAVLGVLLCFVVARTELTVGVFLSVNLWAVSVMQPNPWASELGWLTFVVFVIAIFSEWLKSNMGTARSVYAHSYL